MHEFPITQRIIQMAEDRCREHGGLRVTDIGLVVGLYSGFIGESIQMYFDVLTEGTLCEGARLHIRTVKPQLRCSACNQLFERVPMSFACPVCGGEGHPTEIGKEFHIESIDVETDAAVEAEVPSGTHAGDNATASGKAESRPDADSPTEEMEKPI